MIIHKGTYTVRFMDNNTSRTFASLQEAQEVAEEYCGNGSYNKPFPAENTFLYGPGDGTTTVMIREDIEFH